MSAGGECSILSGRYLIVRIDDAASPAATLAGLRRASTV
jgi:hypothetical protein